MNVMVLGASGFIGRWVVRALSSHGANVSAVVRDPVTAGQLFQRYGIEAGIHRCNLEAPELLPDLIHRLRPSVVFNLAGYGVDHTERDEAAAFRINAALVEAIYDALPIPDPNWPGQQLVQVGSALEYGEISGDLVETSVPNPTTFYGKSKLAATCWLKRRCERYGTKAVTARLFTVYGPGEHTGRLLPTLLQCAQTGSIVPLTSGVQKRDFTYVEDAVTGLLQLGFACVSPGEPVNVATGRLTSIREFAQTAASILGIPNEKLGFNVIQTRFLEMEHSPVNIQRLRTVSGWAPDTTIAEGIRKTLAFFLAQRKELH